MAKKDLIQKRNANLVEEYIRLSNLKNEKGQTKYNHEAVIEILQEKFYLAGYTINKILSKK